MVNHCVVDITSEEELTAISEAIENSKDNVSEHLQQAVMHFVTCSTFVNYLRRKVVKKNIG